MNANNNYILSNVIERFGEDDFSLWTVEIQEPDLKAALTDFVRISGDTESVLKSLPVISLLSPETVLNFYFSNSKQSEIISTEVDMEFIDRYREQGCSVRGSLQGILSELNEMDDSCLKMPAGFIDRLPLPQPNIPFNYLPFPNPDNEKTVKEINSGLSIVKDEEHHFFIAVHKTLAERDLTPTALIYAAEKTEDFYFYGAISCAIPIHELSLKYPEISDVVLNRDSLAQTMVSKAPNYVEYWNTNHAKPGEEIKPNDSIPMMFLQEHFDFEAAATNEQEADTDYEQADGETEFER